MPLIKDKDRYKKLSARDRGRGRVTEDSNLPNKSINTSQREKQNFTEERKLKESKSSGNFNSVKSIYVPANTLTNIFTLSKGQTLKKFLIANTESALLFDLHWSNLEQKNLSFTEGTGTFYENNEIQNTTRLFRRNLSAYDSFAGANDTNTIAKVSETFDIEDLFNNVDRNIYFYYLANNVSWITYLITD